MDWRTIERVGVLAGIVASVITLILGVAALLGLLVAIALPHFAAADGGGQAQAVEVADERPTTATGARPATTAVYAIDVTISVSQAFVDRSLRAFAASVPRLVRGDQGPVRIYVRRIGPSLGDDSGAVAAYTIPAVRACENAFDQRCRNARAVDLRGARTRAAVIAAQILQLRLARTRTGSAIRSAFAAAGEVLASSNGDKWLVVASDLRPSNEPPSQADIELRGVRVAVVFACEQAIDKCQARKRFWSHELRSAGAASVTFLTAQQGDLLFTGGRN